MGDSLCPRCNCGNLTQLGNPEIFRCPDCKKQFKLVEIKLCARCGEYRDLLPNGLCGKCSKKLGEVG